MAEIMEADLPHSGPFQELEELQTDPILMQRFPMRITKYPLGWLLALCGGLLLPTQL